MPEPQAGPMRVMRPQDLAEHMAMRSCESMSHQLDSRTLEILLCTVEYILACLKSASHPLNIHAAHPYIYPAEAERVSM